ncbi:MAG: 2-phosphosulfolactate phosphatase [Desulfotomaculales bacterium]
MRVEILFKPEEILKNSLNGKAAAVFDVLRASSTIVTALANGCRAVYPAAEIEEAREIALELAQAARHGKATGRAGKKKEDQPDRRQKAQTGPPADAPADREAAPSAAEEVLLGGERGGERIPGFPLGNSPLEYGPETVRGKVLVLTTTNGTRAVRLAAEKTGLLFIGSLLNARATAEKLWALKKDAVLICAGTEGGFSLEDAVAAGFVAGEILRLAREESGRAPGAGCPEEAPATAGNIWLSEAAVAAYRLSQYYGRNVAKAFTDSRHGQKLLRLGRGEDLEYCSRRDVFGIVPFYRDGKISICPCEKAGQVLK